MSGRVHLISESFIFNTHQLPCSFFDLQLPGFIAMHKVQNQQNKMTNKMCDLTANFTSKHQLWEEINEGVIKNKRRTK